MRRSRLEMINDFLEATRKHPDFSKSRLFAYSNINATIAAEMIEILQRTGFIKVYKKSSRRHYIKLTRKGYKWLRDMKLLCERVSEFLVNYQPIPMRLFVDPKNPSPSTPPRR
ncbi:MAG: hypothetical protein IBV52_08685 [Candidatus Bathyarchaeota archaeon]